jgi:hypothetical protein
MQRNDVISRLHMSASWWLVVEDIEEKMRIKRAKQNKRNMAVYSGSFGFREPFQMLSK